jgi:hypothetical protein
MEGWHDFFVAEVGAAAALAGLLFVSISVNEEHILQFPGLPERALQAFSSLFLVFAVASLALAPDHTPRSFGAEALALAVFQVSVLTWLQLRSFQPGESYSGRSLRSFLIGQAASWAFVLGSALVVVRDDWSGLAWYPVGVILAFGFAGAVSWVLLIEIKR